MSETETDGGPAFAALASSPMGDVYEQPGMTLRDWFAGQALGMAIPAYAYGGDATELLAHRCYTIADAMLAQRKRKATTT